MFDPFLSSRAIAATRLRKFPAPHSIRPGTCLWLCLLWPLTLLAADQATLDQISPSFVENYFSSLGENGEAGTDEEVQKYYQLALESLARSEAARNRVAELERSATEADTLTIALNNQIAQQNRTQRTTANISIYADDNELPGLLDAAQHDVTSLRETLTQAENKLRELQAAPLTLRQRVTSAENELSELENELSEDPLQPESLNLTPQRVSQLARYKALNNELDRYRAALSTLEPRTRVATLRRDLASLKLLAADNYLSAVQARSDSSQFDQLEDTRKETEQLRNKLDEADASVRDLLVENIERAEEKSELTRSNLRTATALREAKQQLAALKQQIETTRQRVAIGGANPALAVILREERQNLRNYRVVEQNIRGRLNEIERVSFRQLALGDDIRVPVSERVDEILLQRSEISEQATPDTEDVTRILLERDTITRNLTSTYAEYLGLLSELELTQHKIAALLRDHRAFLDQQLLWLPSASPLNLRLLRTTLSAINWALDFENLQAIGATVLNDLANSTLFYLAAFVALGIYPRTRRVLRETVDELSDNVRRARSDRFIYTPISLLAIGLTSAVIPLIIYFFGWRFEVAATDGGRVLPFGIAMQKAALVLFPMIAIRRVCRAGGLAEKHFRRDPEWTRILHRTLSWAMWAIPLLLFVYVAMDQQDNPQFRQALGRLALMGAALLTARMFQRLLSPGYGLPSNYVAAHRGGWLDNFSFIWFGVALAVPLGLVLAAAVGYQYTAAILLQRVLATAVVIAAAWLSYELSVRWIYVARRRIRLEQALERQENTPADGDKVTADSDLDLMEIDTNSRQLIRVLIAIGGLFACWVLWSEVLPALDIFGEVELWQYTHSVGDVIETVPVNLRDLIVALGLGVLFAFGARDIPPVLQIAFLQHLPLDAGSRYAVRALVQYLIIAVGVVVVFSQLGFSWSQVQWLVAALGVGLGFGLQEIFANFISGLIILFERPIRVGDMVTVDEVTGTIERIKIRATTLRDWDNKEVIVPNKTFLTSRVINWTLTDPVARVVIPIGVSYGDDTELASKLILDVAKEHPQVRREPSPKIYFRGLGDSSLDFELWIYVDALTERIPVTHDILMAVEKALPEHNITIPFPQRDVHVYAEKAAAPPGQGLAGGTES